MEQLANLNWVTDDLATGGDLSYADDKAIQQAIEIAEVHEITRVIDLRIEDNDDAVWKLFPTVTYLHVPTNDAWGHVVHHSVFDIAVAACRNMGPGEKALLHCHMGINRGPSAAYAVLLDRGMDPIEAFDLIREKRPQAGLAYALDALKADQRRRPYEPVTMREDRERLERHIDAIWTAEERQRIGRIIRSHRRVDVQERMSVVSDTI